MYVKNGEIEENNNEATEIDLTNNKDSSQECKLDISVTIKDEIIDNDASVSMDADVVSSSESAKEKIQCEEENKESKIDDESQNLNNLSDTLPLETSLLTTESVNEKTKQQAEEEKSKEETDDQSLSKSKSKPSSGNLIAAVGVKDKDEEAIKENVVAEKSEDVPITSNERVTRKRKPRVVEAVQNTRVSLLLFECR